MNNELIKNKVKGYLMLSQIIIALLSLVVGKITAIYFLPKDFGIFNLQFAIYTFFFSLLISPFVQYLKTVSKTFLPKIGYKSFLYLSIFLTSIFYFFLVLIFSINYGFSYKLFLIFAIMIPANLVFSIVSDYFNIQNKINLFSGISLFKNIGSFLFLGILFYVNYKYSDSSTILWAVQLVGLLLASIVFLPYCKFNFLSSYKISYVKFFKRYFIYSWPLVILAFWSWINNYFDRFAIEYYLDFKSVGIYNANYAVGSRFFLLLNPFFLTLLTPNVYNNSNIKLRKTSINNYVKIYTVISIPVLIIIYFLQDFIGLLLLSKSYKSGFYLIFWTSLAYFFLTVVFLYETIFYAESKTKVILYSNIISAVINIFLNMLLIPLYGLEGAIVSTLLSFGIKFFVVQYYYKKL